jgi:hypothetical protein
MNISMRIVSVDLNRPRVGQMYALRQSVQGLFGSAFASSSSSSSSTHSSQSKPTASSSSKSMRAMKRPCIVIKTIPNIEVVFLSNLTGKNVNDRHLLSIDQVPYNFILNRLLPIHPTRELQGRRPIKRIMATTPAVNLTNAYVILIPRTITKETWNNPLPDHVDEEDIHYIKSLLQQIAAEENDPSSMKMDTLMCLLQLADDDENSGTTESSIPVTRKILLDIDTTSSHDRVVEWLLTSEITLLESKTRFASHSF